jgi:hypothetical protein
MHSNAGRAMTIRRIHGVMVEIYVEPVVYGAAAHMRVKIKGENLLQRSQKCTSEHMVSADMMTFGESAGASEPTATTSD